MINEGTISNKERVIRTLRGIIQAYRSDVDLDSVSFNLSTKGNWIVKDLDDKKICLISKFILSKDMADALGYYSVSESFEDGDLVDRNHIYERLKELGVPAKNCIINDNGMVDLIKDTKVTNRNIMALGVQFGKCSGSFDVSSCLKLETLMGCPDEVDGDFNCSNTSITKLQGCPDYVEGDFYCVECKRLQSVKDSPIKIDGDVYLKDTKVDVTYLERVCKIKGDIIK